jgi:multiple sugar transport system ATP-binding protein
MSFGLRVAGVPKAEIEARVAKAADMLHLGELLNRRPAQLSGGQRQRVAIGRAVVRDAKVYLFDEPLSNLDAKLRAELRRELKQLHLQLGATMIYVTHDQVEAMTLADRIAVMKTGVIQQIGTPDEIYTRPVNLFVAGFLGSPTMNTLRGQLVERNGVPTFTGSALDTSVADYPFALNGAAGPGAREVVLGVRAEQVSLGRAGDPATPHSGRLTLIEPLGAHKIVWLDVAGTTVAAIADDRWQAPLGSQVGFGFELARASIFDAATEQRL